MLIFSVTKAQPIKVTIGDNVFIYIWYDKKNHKMKAGFKSPEGYEVFKENIDMDKYFEERNKYNE